MSGLEQAMGLPRAERLKLTNPHSTRGRSRALGQAQEALKRSVRACNSPLPPLDVRRKTLIHTMGELFIAFGILSAIIWIVIGWRAMRAHERMADSVVQHLGTLSREDTRNLRKENAASHKHYRQFLLETPDAERLPSKERHERFRDWLRARGEHDPEEGS